ncbi:uncharacterized protein LOC115877406 [Sitophilus oryzae]|uniref:Uncharacterized protein LOC115877406 n=1 Tax=Sitophilus oryzae TaxID=7048 RepID=A0A6J2XEN8_SITOR|nr:uncharacterized protein LOC115877406 [Sitophilus oryzae]
MCATARTSKMLRSKWDSLKKTTKKEYGEYKQSLYKTRGGPGSSDFKMSGYMKRILAVVRIGMSGTCSKFDCDFDLPNSSNKLLTEDSSSISSQVPIVPTEVISNEDIAAEEITIDKDSSDAAEIISLSSWQTWNPQQLRQPKSIELTVPEPNNTDLEDTNEQVTKTIGVTPCCSNDVKKKEEG